MTKQQILERVKQILDVWHHKNVWHYNRVVHAIMADLHDLYDDLERELALWPEVKP